MQTICDSSKSTYHCTKLENRIHHESWVAFMAWEEAPSTRSPRPLCSSTRPSANYMTHGPRSASTKHGRRLPRVPGPVYSFAGAHIPPLNPELEPRARRA